MVLKGALGPATSALLAAAECGILTDEAECTQLNEHTERTQAIGEQHPGPEERPQGETQDRSGCGADPSGARSPPDSGAEALEGHQLAVRALRVATRMAGALARMYAREPWMDVTGQSHAEAARVADRAAEMLSDMGLGC